MRRKYALLLAVVTGAIIIVLSFAIAWIKDKVAAQARHAPSHAECSVWRAG